MLVLDSEPGLRASCIAIRESKRGIVIMASGMCSFLRALVWMLGMALAGQSEEVLTAFHPSNLTSSFGKVSEIEFSSPLVELEPGALAHHVPQAMKDVRFAEPVWMIGYSTSIVTGDGSSPRENYLCHTFFADQRMAQRNDDEFRGIYSDAFTPDVHVPDGFGILFSPDSRLHWMPMFNNRGDEPVRVRMKVTITLIRAADLKKPLKPLYGSLRSVEVPHLFFVPPGKDERQTSFTSPFTGRIHFLGTHIHPHGVSIGLYNTSRKEQVWMGTRKSGVDGPMQVYSNSEGYPVRAGETYRIVAVYQNPTEDKIDAMAGLFMLYSRE
jgi:hypothetical protein